MGTGLNVLIQFGKDIKHFVVRAINCIILKSELAILQRLGINISCLPKRDKPRQLKKKPATNYSSEFFV